jgi:hypothetical protein
LYGDPSTKVVGRDEFFNKAKTTYDELDLIAKKTGIVTSEEEDKKLLKLDKRGRLNKRNYNRFLFFLKIRKYSNLLKYLAERSG